MQQDNDCNEVPIIIQWRLIKQTINCLEVRYKLTGGDTTYRHATRTTFTFANNYMSKQIIFFSMYPINIRQGLHAQ